MEYELESEKIEGDRLVKELETKLKIQEEKGREEVTSLQTLVNDLYAKINDLSDQLASRVSL